MAGWQAKYDPWGSSDAVVDMQNAVSTRHNLTQDQASAVGNIIHTLTYNRSYRFEEMPGLFDKVFGYQEPCNCNVNMGKRKPKPHIEGAPGCFYYMSFGE